MAPLRCAKGCLDQNGSPVLLAGHKNKCPYRLNNAPIPVVDSPVDTLASSPATAPSPGLSAGPLSPDTVRGYAGLDSFQYDADPYASFGSIALTPSALSPNFDFNFSMHVDTQHVPFRFGTTVDTSPLGGMPPADGSLDLDDLSGVVTSALGDQYDQLSLDLNSLLNISPAATPQGPVGAPLSPIQYPDMDVDMASVPSPALVGNATPSSAHSPAAAAMSPLPSAPSTPSAPVASATANDHDPQPLVVQRQIVPRTTTGNRKRKRVRDDDDDEPQLSFIASSSSRTKAHSKRAQVLLRKALAINSVTRPYVLLYIARPESICQKNGTAVTFISNNLRAILGDTFLDDIHEQVAQGAHDNTAQTARDTNMQVERLRQEKKAEELRRQEAETAQKAAEAEAAKLRAQVAALEAAHMVA
ncbi:hypothetical protein K466DRAFT_606432 [Polyporus arcularius HHB13444]|uniref:Uncharacterized protein n=1 Tax=Polyporus arcularius HHB13444 TaxID=1314778 RepID=A0A5C3NST1_9APHY|nr:hypothetical protein K466DRAFT_606432 [Polyporus arcularius HHB13444]